MRWRNEPAFQRSSSVSRLSETQSAAGVIWSVSIASSFFPGTFRSQKISAFPRITGPPAALSPPSDARGPGRASRVMPGLRRAGWMADMGSRLLRIRVRAPMDARGSGVGAGRGDATARPHEPQTAVELQRAGFLSDRERRVLVEEDLAHRRLVDEVRAAAGPEREVALGSVQVVRDAVQVLGQLHLD